MAITIYPYNGRNRHPLLMFTELLLDEFKDILLPISTNHRFPEKLILSFTISIRCTLFIELLSLYMRIILLSMLILENLILYNYNVKTLI